MAKKIFIAGISGSGKSTLARRLSEKLQLPVFHLDRHFWQPGWVMPEKSMWRDSLEKISSESQWVVDGNYSAALEVLLPEADAIILLNSSRPAAILRCLKRMALSYGRNRNDMAENCPEKFDLDFIKYIWNFKKDKLPKIENALIHHANDKKIIRMNGCPDISLVCAKLQVL